jgi:hypothetical protein
MTKMLASNPLGGFANFREARMCDDLEGHGVFHHTDGTDHRQIASAVEELPLQEGLTDLLVIEWHVTPRMQRWSASEPEQP